jgi:hypothetical protein
MPMVIKENLCSMYLYSAHYILASTRCIYFYFTHCFAISLHLYLYTTGYLNLYESQETSCSKDDTILQFVFIREEEKYCFHTNLE